MGISSESQKWIEAVKVFDKNVDAKIICPKCQKDLLKILDVHFENGEGFERYMYCDACGAKNIALYRSDKKELQ